jgi:hypothetical protein
MSMNAVNIDELTQGVEILDNSTEPFRPRWNVWQEAGRNVRPFLELNVFCNAKIVEVGVRKKSR